MSEWEGVMEVLQSADGDCVYYMSSADRHRHPLAVVNCSLQFQTMKLHEDSVLSWLTLWPHSAVLPLSFCTTPSCCAFTA